MSTIANTYPSYKKVAGIGLATALFLTSGRASAVDCTDLPAPILFGLGGSATKPLLGKVAAGLAAAASPVTIVYQAPGACVGINGLIGNTPITGSASYWGTDGAESTCTLPQAGVAVDFANMGNTAVSCPGISALPADIVDVPGPVNTYDLIVPTASSQTSISSEAVYFAFGFGQTGQAQPWVDESALFRRDSNSAAQLFIALASGVPVEKFKGIDTKNNAGTVTAVAQSLTPQAALGLVSGEVADGARSSVKILAYQHKGQTCGYLPDSTATSFDKKNVRNGKYHIWAPIHFFAKADPTTKKIAKPELASFIGYFGGTVDPPSNVDLLNLEIKSGNVPRCAMSVWRDTDLGPISKNVPDKPCGCYFDSVATGATSCTPCADNSACPSVAPVCRRNFCEAR